MTKLIQIMVYINKNSDEFVIIPKHLPSVSRVYDLRLVNNLSKVESIFPSITSTSKNSLLYCFKLNINDFEEGEYTYTITNPKGVCMDRGLLKIVGEESKTIKYNEEKNIVVYNG